jgi:hypothetical protein
VFQERIGFSFACNFYLLVNLDAAKNPRIGLFADAPYKVFEGVLMAAESEKIYECQVKRRRLKIGGGYEPFWKLKSVTEALVDDDTEFRCPDCTGAVKIHRHHVPDSPPPHIAHKLKSDSEYCPAGLFFRKATDGRQPRMSEHPVR